MHLTEGIIQKTFNKLYKEVVIDEISVYRIKALEQELIEEINNSFKQFNSWDRDLIQRILRGETE